MPKPALPNIYRRSRGGSRRSIASWVMKIKANRDKLERDFFFWAVNIGGEKKGYKPVEANAFGEK